MHFRKEEQPEEETRAQSTNKQDVISGLEEARTGRGSAGLVQGRDGGRERQADETSGKGKGQGNGGKGEHESKGGLGSKEGRGRRRGGRNTRSNAIVGSEVTVEYIDDEGEQRGPFSNSEMRQWWEERNLPEDLQLRPCDARVLANTKTRNRHIAFRIVKWWSEDAPAVFATEFAPRGECEYYLEGEEE